MKKGKMKYLVYLITDIYENESPPTTYKSLVGTTLAVSAAQAVNNVRFNLDGEKPNIQVNGCGSSCAVHQYMAIPYLPKALRDIGKRSTKQKQPEQIRLDFNGAAGRVQ